MKIFSLNAWHGTRELELRELLTAELASMDIFCFQEADGELIQQIFHDIFPSDEFHKLYANKLSGSYPDALASFVRKDIDLIDNTVLLENTGDSAGYSQVMHLREKNRDIFVANVHGAPYPGDKLDTPGRILQSQTIIDHLSQCDGIRIACGDFNLDPSTESVRIFRQSNYLDLIRGYNIETTRNDLAWRRFPGHEQKFADYVFVSRDATISNFTVPYSLASDHLPLIVELDISQTHLVVAGATEKLHARLATTRR